MTKLPRKKTADVSTETIISQGNTNFEKFVGEVSEATQYEAEHSISSPPASSGVATPEVLPGLVLRKGRHRASKETKKGKESDNKSEEKVQGEAIVSPEQLDAKKPGKISKEKQKEARGGGLSQVLRNIGSYLRKTRRHKKPESPKVAVDISASTRGETTQPSPVFPTSPPTSKSTFLDDDSSKFENFPSDEPPGKPVAEIAVSTPSTESFDPQKALVEFKSSSSDMSQRRLLGTPVVKFFESGIDHLPTVSPTMSPTAESRKMSPRKHRRHHGSTRRSKGDLTKANMAKGISSPSLGMKTHESASDELTIPVMEVLSSTDIVPYAESTTSTDVSTTSSPPLAAEHPNRATGKDQKDRVASTETEKIKEPSPVYKIPKGESTMVDYMEWLVSSTPTDRSDQECKIVDKVEVGRSGGSTATVGSASSVWSPLREYVHNERATEHVTVKGQASEELNQTSGSLVEYHESPISVSNEQSNIEKANFMPVNEERMGCSVSTGSLISFTSNEVATHSRSPQSRAREVKAQRKDDGAAITHETINVLIQSLEDIVSLSSYYSSYSSSQ